MIQLVLLWMILWDEDLILLFLQKVFDSVELTMITSYYLFIQVSNGVKQGGVLSPILFSFYLDKLLVLLCELGIGCHMNGLFTVAFIYADDITIIAPFCYALNSVLNVCEEYSLSHDILFNSLKTKYMFLVVIL